MCGNVHTTGTGSALRPWSLGGQAIRRLAGPRGGHTPGHCAAGTPCGSSRAFAVGSPLLLQTRGDPSTPVAPGVPCTAPSSRQPLNAAGLLGLEEPRGNSGLGSTVQGMAVPLRRARIPGCPRVRPAGNVHIAFQNMKSVPNWRHHCVPHALVASFKSSAWWKEAQVPSCWLLLPCGGWAGAFGETPLPLAGGLFPLRTMSWKCFQFCPQTLWPASARCHPCWAGKRLLTLGVGSGWGASAQSLGVSTQRGLLCWDGHLRLSFWAQPTSPLPVLSLLILSTLGR